MLVSRRSALKDGGAKDLEGAASGDLSSSASASASSTAPASSGRAGRVEEPGSAKIFAAVSFLLQLSSLRAPPASDESDTALDVRAIRRVLEEELRGDNPPGDETCGADGGAH